MHSHRVLEFEPELAVQVSCLLGLKVVKFVITFHLLNRIRLIFLDAEDQVILDDDRRPEAASTDLILVNSDHTVVTRE